MNLHLGALVAWTTTQSHLPLLYFEGGRMDSKTFHMARKMNHHPISWLFKGTSSIVNLNNGEWILRFHYFHLWCVCMTTFESPTEIQCAVFKNCIVMHQRTSLELNLETWMIHDREVASVQHIICESICSTTVFFHGDRDSIRENVVLPSQGRYCTSCVTQLTDRQLCC